MRWKLFFWLNPNASSKKQTFGFKSENTAPANILLKPFEDDLLETISKIEYKKVTNPLQTRMEEDKKKINECDDIIVQADKTSNLYKMSPDQYKKLLLETITTEYKKTDENKVSKTNEEAARITDKLDISDRVDAMTRAKAYITVKDHKPRFPDKIDCRLINPSKTYIGKISKSILDRINNDIKQKIPMNLLF